METTTIEKQLQEILEKRARDERKSYIRTVFLIVVPLLIGGLWWLFTVDQVQQLQAQKSQLEEQVQELELRTEVLTATQNDILEFLEQVTSKEKIGLLGSDVDWDRTKKEIMDLSPGKRKQAIYAAILLAWQEIPFELGRESLSLGFDSPRFLRFVLSQVGLRVENQPGVPLSVTLMQKFEKVSAPMPGDLMFYKGQVGNFGFIYLAEGRPEGQGVGVGTLQKIAPLRIMDTRNVNTPFFPFVGYFRVTYPDE